MSVVNRQDVATIDSRGHALLSLFDGLGRESIDYAVLRNFEGFPQTIGNDVDVLIRETDYLSFLEVAKAAFIADGFFTRAHRQQSNGYLVKATHACGDGIVSLSIHVQFWVSIELSMLQEITPGYSYRVFFDDLSTAEYTAAGVDFRVPSAADRFVLLFRQALFKRTDRYNALLSTLADDPKVLQLCRDSDVDHRDVAVNDNFTDGAKALSRLVRSQWGEKTIFANAIVPIASSIGRKAPVFAPVVYVTGPDGAGKTSVSSHARQVLHDAGFNVKHVYSVKRNIIRHLIFAVRRKITGSEDNKFSDRPEDRKFRFIMTEDITDRDDGTRSWRLRKYVTLLISIFDVFVNLVPLTFFRLKYDVVVVETSPYDIFIKYHMPKFEHLENIFAPLFLMPALGLLLVADSTKIAERKLELTSTEIDEYYRRLDALLDVSGASSRFYPVQTDCDIEETCSTVSDLLRGAV